MFMAEEDQFARIRDIEAAHRRFKWYATVAIVVLAGSIVIVMLRTQPRKTVEAREFLLKDQSGQVLARLGATGLTGTCLEILGKAKEASATICAGDESGSDLQLTTHRGQSRAYLSAGGKLYEALGQTIAPSLIIADGDGANLLSVAVGPKARFLLGHGSEENSVVISISQDKPRISISTKAGKVLWSAP
jgi:hypothetical protein